MKKLINQLRSLSSEKSFLILFLTLCIAFFLTGCDQAESSETPKTEGAKVEAVSKPKTFTLAKEKFTPQVELTGTVEANKQVSINSAIGGRVEAVKVETGDFVKKGQILVTLSAHDNTAEIQYQNALNTFGKTENTIKNNIYQAEVQLENANMSLEKMERTQDENYANIFNSLVTQAKSTESTLKDVFNWADRTLLATEEAKRGTSDASYYNLGSNQTIEKQAIKNEIIELYTKYTDSEIIKIIPEFNLTEKGEKIVLDYAQKHLEIAEKLRVIARRINTLIIKTSTHSNFSVSTRYQFQQESDKYLSLLESTILTLDKGIKSTTSQRKGIAEAISSGKNQVRSAETGLDFAKASSEGTISTARNQIRIAQLSRNELSLKAPFDGVIIKKNIEAGQLVGTGTALLEIADMSKFKIKTDIPDVWVSDAQNNEAKTEIRISGIRDQVFLGRVDKIDPAVDPTTRKIGIEIVLEKPVEVIKIGMFARITLLIPEIESYFIPRKFLKSDFNGAFVKFLDGTKKYIEKGFEQDNKVQINFAGMEEGTVIIN